MTVEEMKEQGISLFDLAVAQTGMAMLLGALVETLDAEAPGLADKYREKIEHTVAGLVSARNLDPWDDGGVERFMRHALVYLPKKRRKAAPPRPGRSRAKP